MMDLIRVFQFLFRTHNLSFLIFKIITEFLFRSYAFEISVDTFTSIWCTHDFSFTIRICLHDIINHNFTLVVVMRN